MKDTIKKISQNLMLLSILLCFNIFCMENNYSDIQSMLLGIKPFEDEIESGYLNVEYNNENISNISWFDDDSVRFTKIFHYNNNNLFLITELRESIILKEIFFTNHKSAERFIDYLFGENFETEQTYITEIRYNKSKLPIYYEFKSMKS